MASRMTARGLTAKQVRHVLRRRSWVLLGLGILHAALLFGGLNAGGEMVLAGDLQQASGYGGRSRGTWTQNADGTVRQRFETYDSGKSAWVENFNGLYKPRK